MRPKVTSVPLNNDALPFKDGSKKMNPDRARTNLICRQADKTVIHLFGFGAALAFFTMLSWATKAADLALPPRPVAQPRYGLAPPPAVPPAQVIIVPGATAPPPYYGEMPPPPVVGSSPYRVPVARLAAAQAALAEASANSAAKPAKK